MNEVNSYTLIIIRVSAMSELFTYQVGVVIWDVSASGSDISLDS